MVSREHNRAALHEKLQLLRSITNSNSQSKNSILLDASKYIKELKQKVEILNQDMDTAQSSNNQNESPTVTVETLEDGLLINISSGKSCPGLLVFILEAFELLNLNVMEARVSCKDSFQLRAVGGESEEGNGQSIEANVVKQAVSQAIKNWKESADGQE